MNHPKKGFKGFSIRRPGRPAGSRAVDRGQSDFFPAEKLISQIRPLVLRQQGKGSVTPD